jgi:predicted nucleic acid-binding protein
MVYFDCVINETINVLARRAKERKRSSEFTELLTRVVSQAPEDSIIWISKETRRFYPEIIDLVRDSMGALNFNDILVALGCRELGIECIATFDSDFDSIAWLKRLSSPNDITSSLTPSR